MKAIYRTILAAAAAIMALNSCVVDNVIPDRETVNKTDGSRIISISFGPGTKTVLDGFQPKFAEGDTIKVSNGVSAPEIRLVKVDAQGNAYFTTDLMGALKAVYPASAAELKKNDKQIDTIYGVKVPATQSGKFASANICMAEIQDAATTATFVNQVAILKFYVDKSIGVKSITVTSDTNLASGSKTITVDPEADATINTITDDPQKRICYVAVLPGEKSNLKFSSETTTQGTVERQLTVDTNLERNGMYNAFIPYYIDLGKAGKWAYCNIGAFLPEETGKYFAWGDTQGQTWNGSSWSSEFATIEGNPDTLKLENDAAHVIWGGSWRMPTKAQLDTLAASTKEWITEAKGYKLYTASADTSIFLPAAGSSEDMSKVGASGEYWSSSLNTEEKTLAYKLGICNGSATTATMSRTVGATIRPFRHIPVDSIKLNKTKDTVKIDNVATLIATVYPANASDTLVTWTSSNTAVATVDQRGHITGVAGGTATITARIIDLDGTEKSATCEVKVPAQVTGVTLNKTSITALNVGSTETLTTTITPSANTIIVSTTWTSDKTSIATVDNNGKVTGVAPGTAKITVEVKDVYNIVKTAECSVEVKPNVPEGAISGKFSVRADLQVYFSKGNLYCKRSSSTSSDWTWHFYDNQYDFQPANRQNKITEEWDKRLIANEDTIMDFFCWGYTSNISGPRYRERVEVKGEKDVIQILSKSEDWGYVFGGDLTIWRTLTRDEWQYLFGESTERSGKHKLKVSVCGKSNCLVIAPDDWDLTANPLKDSYDATEWAAAEANGLVCLPASGSSSDKGNELTSIGYYGEYWTSIADGRNTIYLSFNSNGKISYSKEDETVQECVRLVTDVE